MEQITTKEARELFGFFPDKYLKRLWIAEANGKNSFLMPKKELQEIRKQWTNYYYK